MRDKYSIFSKEKIVAALLILVVVFLLGAIIGSYCFGEEPLATCWIMCKPGSYVTIRSEPSKNSDVRGYLDSGDSFQTDGESIDGWIRCYGIGEGGWVYTGYVALEKPRLVYQRYECVANKQVACRKWMSGPQIDERPWMRSGETCEVYVTDGEWAVTSRGYVKFEYLDVMSE